MHSRPGWAAEEPPSAGASNLAAPVAPNSFPHCIPSPTRRDGWMGAAGWHRTLQDPRFGRARGKKAKGKNCSWRVVRPRLGGQDESVSWRRVQRFRFGPLREARQCGCGMEHVACGVSLHEIIRRADKGDGRYAPCAAASILSSTRATRARYRRSEGSRRSSSGALVKSFPGPQRHSIHCATRVSSGPTVQPCNLADRVASGLNWNLLT